VPVQIFPDDQGFDGSTAENVHGFVDSLNELAGVETDFVEESAQQLLFFDELQASDDILREFDGLVKSTFLAVADVHSLEHHGREAVVNVFVDHDLLLEVCRPSNDDASHIDLVVLDENLVGLFGHLSDLVLSLLHAQPAESRCGLPALAVFLGQVHGLAHDDFLVSAHQRSEQTAVSVHDDEAELVFRVQQRPQVLSVEFAIAELNRYVDWALRFKVDDDLLLSLLGHDCAYLEHQSVFRCAIV